MIKDCYKDALLRWYEANKRDLPWRKSRDPYAIWLSETMLQQTTSQAVIPYFEKFLQRFPTVKKLAQAEIGQVLELWSGLGYYSRARNLHKAAQSLSSGFPKTSAELMELPGFGPYTSRAVASIAFGESVGVIDGNVIRVLCRWHGLEIEWWKTRERSRLQTLADEWVKDVSSSTMNQALMELGATVCLAKTPRCALCPIMSSCQGLQKSAISQLPRKKPRREKELWVWQPMIRISRGRILIARNKQAPFLRDQWLLPAVARRIKKAPKRFDFKHTITHHEIFVTLNSSPNNMTAIESKWIPLAELKHHVPVSLVQKSLAQVKRLSSVSRVPQG